MLRIFTVVAALAWATNCYALVEFQVTEANMGWNGFHDAASGVVFWDITSTDKDGNVLVVSDARGAGHGLFRTGSVNVGIADVDTPFPRGLSGVVSDFPEISLNGTKLENADLRGRFQVLGDSDIAPPFTTKPGTMPGEFLPQGGEVSDLPVRFNVDFQVFASESDTDALYRLAGFGDGTATASFATLSPNSHDVILQTGASFDLNVADPNVVPEPQSLAVWSLLAVGAALLARRKHGHVDESA